MNKHHYHLPIRPYSPIDALNRRAAALGSPGYARQAHDANYNGHHVTVSWNDYRRYYVCEYYWGGRHVLARGTAEACIAAALVEYNRGALGASVQIELSDDDVSVVELFPQLQPGPCEFRPSWHTWRHVCAAAAARDAANPRLPVLIFDWELMQATEDREAYEAALRQKHGRVYT